MDNSMSSEELIKVYQATKDPEIRQELTLRYLYIVRSIAVQMRDVYLSFAQVEDIVNEGVIVLMKALDKYDENKNAKFETYVSRRIWGMIIDIARKQDWVPRTVRKAYKDIQDTAMQMYAESGKMPSPEELAEAVGMKVEKLQDIMGKMNLFSVMSLDMVMEETQEKQKVSSLLTSDFAKMPEEQYLENEFRQILREGIQSLKEKEQLVITLYYVEELNMKEIASVLGLSEPRISQIHSNAVNKLRYYIEQKSETGKVKKKPNRKKEAQKKEVEWPETGGAQEKGRKAEPKKGAAAKKEPGKRQTGKKEAGKKETGKKEPGKMA